MAKYMYHFTRDGEYVDGVCIDENHQYDNDLLQKLAQTYEGCHVWAKRGVTEGSWMNIVVVAMPYGRWDTTYLQNVPECVRIAEFVRDKS